MSHSLIFSLCLGLGVTTRVLAQDVAPQSSVAEAPDVAASAPASLAVQSCTNRDLVRGHFNQLGAFVARCPLPDDGELLNDASSVAVLNDNNAGYQALLPILRALAVRAVQEGTWGRHFALRLRAALDAFEPEQCSQIWDVGFAAVNVPLPSQESCKCAFVSASDGDSDHTCYRFPQPGQSEPPTCDQPRLLVHDFADWRTSARALRIHELARMGLTTLGRSCAAKAIKRLESAEQRWRHLEKYGYVQYPWELWISRLVAPDYYGNYSACFASDKSCNGDGALDPNRVRAIFLHPGIGFGFSGFGTNDGSPSAKAHAVVALEVAGVTLYPESFSWYLGFSAGLGFQDADFADPRLGGYVHLTRWLQAGYLHGVSSTSKNDGTLYLTVDALGWLNRSLGWLEP